MQVSLVQTLGVDGPGPVQVTALATQAGEPAVYQVTGEDVVKAQGELTRQGETRLEVTHVAQLVLGQDAPLGETLWEEIRCRKSGYGATLWLAAGAAEGVLSAPGDVSARLRALEENGGAAAPTLMEALSALSQEGAVTLPVVDVREGELVVTGYRRVEEAWHIEG